MTSSCCGCVAPSHIHLVGVPPCRSLRLSYVYSACSTFKHAMCGNTCGVISALYSTLSHSKCLESSRTQDQADVACGVHTLPRQLPPRREGALGIRQMPCEPCRVQKRYDCVYRWIPQVMHASLPLLAHKNRFRNPCPPSADHKSASGDTKKCSPQKLIVTS